MLLRRRYDAFLYFRDYITESSIEANRTLQSREHLNSEENEENYLKAEGPLRSSMYRYF
jgi:hypothetical protein